MCSSHEMTDCIGPLNPANCSLVVELKKTAPIVGELICTNRQLNGESWTEFPITRIRESPSEAPMPSRELNVKSSFYASHCHGEHWRPKESGKTFLGGLTSSHGRFDIVCEIESENTVSKLSRWRSPSVDRRACISATRLSREEHSCMG